MTNVADMTKAEILEVWKGFVRNMSDQGAVFPFANEIASRARNEMLARLEAAEKERDNANAAAVGVALKAEMLEAERGELLGDRATLQQMVYSLKDRVEVTRKELESWKGLAQQFGNEADALRARIERIPTRITPDQAPAEICEYAPIAAEGYADGWNACIKTITEESK